MTLYAGGYLVLIWLRSVNVGARMTGRVAVVDKLTY